MCRKPKATKKANGNETETVTERNEKECYTWFMKRVGEVEKAISGEDVRLPRLQFQALKPWAYQCVKEHYELVSTMVTVSRAVLFPEKPFTENEVLDNKTLQTALASAYVDAVDKFNRPNFEYEDWKKRRDEFADKKLQG